MTARKQTALSNRDLTTRTHAEAEFAAFSASAKRATAAKVKLPLLGIVFGKLETKKQTQVRC